MSKRQCAPESGAHQQRQRALSDSARQQRRTVADDIALAIVSTMALDSLADAVSNPTLAAILRRLKITGHQERKIAGYAAVLLDKYTNTNTPWDEMELRIARDLYGINYSSDTTDKIMKGNIDGPQHRAEAHEIATLLLPKFFGEKEG